MKLNDNVRIACVKSKALKLRGNYQLPSYLVYLILHIDKNTDSSYLEYLISQSMHYMRVKGYYKKYPLIEKQYNNELKRCCGVVR